MKRIILTLCILASVLCSRAQLPMWRFVTIPTETAWARGANGIRVDGPLWVSDDTLHPMPAWANGRIAFAAKGDSVYRYSWFAARWILFKADQVNADWTASSGPAQILNKPTLATVATTGNYFDLLNRPTIPEAPMNADWSATTGLSRILNKPWLGLQLTTAGSGAASWDSTNRVLNIPQAAAYTNGWGLFLNSFQFRIDTSSAGVPTDWRFRDSLLHYLRMNTYNTGNAVISGNYTSDGTLSNFGASQFEANIAVGKIGSSGNVANAFYGGSFNGGQSTTLISNNVFWNPASHTYDFVNNTAASSMIALGGIGSNGITFSTASTGIPVSRLWLTNSGQVIINSGTGIDPNAKFVLNGNMYTNGYIVMDGITKVTSPTTRYKKMLWDSVLARVWYTDDVGSSGTSYTNADVLTAPLTGYTVGANTVLASSDNVLSAFRKLQGQINATNTTVSGLSSGVSFTRFKQEVTGTTSTTITLTHVPLFPSAVQVFLNGIAQRGIWYSVSGTTLTLNFTPLSSDNFIIFYEY
jgi:hypothetical protein